MTRKIFERHKILVAFASLCVMLFVGLRFWDHYAPIPIHDWNKTEISRIKVADPADFREVSLNIFSIIT